MKNFNGWWIALLLAGSIIAGVSASAYRTKAGTGESGSVGVTSQPQDTFGLERRISSLEQRLYSIESSINRLEQQSTLNARGAPSSNQRDAELDLLRTQVRTLQSQLEEVGCGLVKLDERTLAPSVRQSRQRNASAATEPCRLSPETPLRLSVRP
jgi:hypothetical protein